MPVKKFQVPKSLGAAADCLYQLKEERLRLQKEVEQLEANEKLVKNYLIDNLPKSQALGVAGKVARATIITQVVPSVKAENWPLVFAYIKKKGAFDLMQKRLSTAAVESRWNEGLEIPGVEPFNIVKVSLNKV